MGKNPAVGTNAILWFEISKRYVRIFYYILWDLYNFVRKGVRERLDDFILWFCVCVGVPVSDWLKAAVWCRCCAAGR